MNTEKFIQGLLCRMVACVRGHLEVFSSPPPGRKPRQEDVEMYRWYNSLPEVDKEVVRRLIRRTYESAIYPFLMVLDHKAFVEGRGEKGELELYYRAPDCQRTRLNPLGGENGKDLEYYFKAVREESPPPELAARGRGWGRGTLGLWKTVGFAKATGARRKFWTRRSGNFGRHRTCRFCGTLPSRRRRQQFAIF